MNQYALRTSPHPLQQPGRVLADVCEAADDVVQVEVTEGGMVLALPPHLEKREKAVEECLRWAHIFLVSKGLRAKNDQTDMQPTWFKSKYQQLTGDSRF